MSDWEERLRAAFDAMDVPEGLNGRTLEAIERVRAQEQGRDPSVAEGHGGQASDPARTQEPAQGGAHCGGSAFALRAPSARESASQAQGAASRDAGSSVQVDAGPAPSAPAPQAAPAHRAKAVFWRRAALAAAACLALVVVGVGGYRWYAEPTALVSVDVNPSVELELNRFDTVLAARGVNADGQALVESVPVAGKAYAEAMDALASSEAFSRYVSGDSYVEITVVCDDAEQARALEEVSDACLASLPCEGACRAADSGEWQAAREAGMGVGRYRAALELMACDPSVTLEECARMSMRELRDRIASCGGSSEGGDAAESSQGAGAHGGAHGGLGAGAGAGGASAGGGKGAGRDAGTGSADASGEGTGRAG